MTRVRVALADPKRFSQFLVWVLLTATAVPLLMVLFTQTDPGVSQEPEFAPITALDVAAQDSDLIAAKGSNATGTDPKRFKAEISDEREWLPAYRWMMYLSYPDQHAWWNFTAGIQTQIASIGIYFAQVLWAFVLVVVKFAISTEIIPALAGHINDMYHTLWSAMSTSGVLMIVVMAGLAMAAFAVFRGKVGDGIKIVAGGVIIISLMQFLGAAIDSPLKGRNESRIAQSQFANTTVDQQNAARNDTINAKGRSPRGTPAWLAETAVTQVDTLALSIGSLFGVTDGVIKNAAGGMTSVEDGGATCSGYIESLHRTYERADTKMDKSTKNTLAMMSFVWERSVYDNWVWGTFGATPNSARIACHYAEIMAGVPPNVQRAVALGAGGTFDGIASGPFMPDAMDTKEFQSALFAWAACAGPTQMRDGWKHIEYKFKNPKDGDLACGKWWGSEAQGGDAHKHFEFDWSSPTHVFRDVKGNNNLTTYHNPKTSASVKNALDDVETTTLTYWGKIHGPRWISTIVSLFTSVMYGFLLLGAALGSLLSQFVVGVMMFILPVTLLLLALPTKDGSRNPTGMRLLRLTLTSFGGKLVFQILLGFIITLLALLFSIGGSVIGAANKSSSSLMQMFIYGLWAVIVPIATMWLLKKLLKLFGMDQFTGLKGAAKFATAAVSQGEDGKWLSQKRNSMETSKEKPGKIRGVLSAGAGALMTQGKQFAKSEASSRRASKLLARTNADGTSFLNRDLRDKVNSGKMSPWQAAREQKARAQLPPELASRVARRELTMGQALRMNEAARGAIMSAAHSRFGKDEGFAKHNDPNRGTFKSRGVSRGEDDYVDANQAATRRDLRRRTMMAEQAATNDPARREQIGVDQLGSETDAIYSQLREDGEAGPLSLSEAHHAKGVYQATLPMALQNDVLMGASGAPPILKPSVDSTGKLQISEDVRNDPAALQEILANPVNLLPPEFVQQRAEETTHEYHARLSTALVDSGLMDEQGRTVNLMHELDIGDLSDPAELEKAVKIVTEWETSGSFSPDATVKAHVKELGAESIARIESTTANLVASIPDVQIDDATLGLTRQLQEAAEEAMDAATEQIGQAHINVSNLDAAVGSSLEYDRLEVSVIRDLTSTLPEQINEALTSKWDAAMHAAELGGGDLQHVQEAAQAEMAQVRDMVANATAEVRLSQGSGSPAAAKDAFAQLSEEYSRLVEEQQQQAQEAFWAGEILTQSQEAGKRSSLNW